MATLLESGVGMVPLQVSAKIVCQVEKETTTSPNKRKHKKTYLVDTEVSRSMCLKKKSKGFKQSHTSSKCCSSCTTSLPPSISSKIIKKLGQEFYKVAPEHPTEDVLGATKKVSSAIQRPRKSDNNEASGNPSSSKETDKGLTRSARK